VVGLFAKSSSWLQITYQPRWVFLAGIVPALIVFWIRRQVPEPDEWREAKRNVQTNQPGVKDLFRGPILWLTLKVIGVCACTLTAWWAFMFWHAQHLRNLPELKGWSASERDQLVSLAFFLVIAVSVGGNFFAGALARWTGYPRAIALMCLGFFLAMVGSFIVPRDYQSLVYFWFPLVGFFSGVCALFTMYLPPLFPTLLRTTGAGFCYNIGRIAAAFGTVYFGLHAKVGDFRVALLLAGTLHLLAALFALLLPQLRDEPAVSAPCPTSTHPG
jgi:predicted MFS family arabinose efflux permease